MAHARAGCPGDGRHGLAAVAADTRRFPGLHDFAGSILGVGVHVIFWTALQRIALGRRPHGSVVCHTGTVAAAHGGASPSWRNALAFGLARYGRSSHLPLSSHCSPGKNRLSGPRLDTAGSTRADAG